MCSDTEDLRNRLKAHELLLKPRFDPDAAVRKVFGTVPVG
jgi:hypothetical protein